MKRIIRRRWLRWLLYGLLAYLMLKTGQYVSPISAQTLHSTNAFLFLLGLGGVYALLSPPKRRLRYR